MKSDIHVNWEDFEKNLTNPTFPSILSWFFRELRRRKERNSCSLKLFSLGTIQDSPWDQDHSFAIAITH